MPPGAAAATPVASAAPAAPPVETAPTAADPATAPPAAAVAAPAFRRERLAGAPSVDACGSTTAGDGPTDDGGPTTAGGGAVAASNSATVAWTGSPADAAIARAAGSAATIDRTRFRSSASRASSRKLIRDVARREPGGRTSATFVSVAFRIRAAALVISSSTSR